MRWNPQQYSKFATPRLRAGFDLLARVPHLSARRVFDLGCGSGELTLLLAERFPTAKTTGIDNSEAMLARARALDAALVTFELGDVAAWSPGDRADVVFSNATLHWLPDHERLFPRLANAVASGGVLAIQMPRNFDAPSHTLMREVAELPQFTGRIPLRTEPVLRPERYFDLLSPVLHDLDIWETEYLHVLEGDDAVLEWTRGTAMLPVAQALQGAELDAFVAEYAEQLRSAYPRRSDGRTLFPFRRIFMVGRRA